MGLGLSWEWLEIITRLMGRIEFCHSRVKGGDNLTKLELSLREFTFDTLLLIKTLLWEKQAHHDPVMVLLFLKVLDH